MKSPKVAVVILSWNGRELLERFLPFLFNDTDNDVAEIIVADNGSTDDSVEFIRHTYPDLRLIPLAENYGFAEGYNRALQEIDAEYAVLLNSDVEVTENWLTPLLAYMNANPDVAACQPKILSWHNRNQYEYAGAAGGFIDKYGYPFCRGRIFSIAENVNPDYNNTMDVFWATGACLMIRLNDFREAGGFDASFFAHMEEIDLCWRLKRQGKRIVCVPKSTVFHIGAFTLKTENPKKTYLNFRNNLLMLHKNLPPETAGRILRMRSFFDFLAAFQFFITGKLANAKAVFQAKRDFKRMKSTLPSTEKKMNSNYGIFPEMYSKSILVDYFLKKKKFFYQLFIGKV